MIDAGLRDLAPALALYAMQMRQSGRILLILLARR